MLTAAIIACPDVVHHDNHDNLFVEHSTTLHNHDCLETHPCSIGADRRPTSAKNASEIKYGIPGNVCINQACSFGIPERHKDRQPATTNNWNITCEVLYAKLVTNAVTTRHLYYNLP